jgi:hypothetical protein
VSKKGAAITSVTPNKPGGLYRCDPTKIPHTLKFWKAAPFALASLLATYLPENKVGADQY